MGFSLFTDEGEYVCPVCTVFGLDKEEVKILCGAGLKFTDHNKEAEGYEVKTSAFKASTNAIKSGHIRRVKRNEIGRRYAL